MSTLINISISFSLNLERLNNKWYDPAEQKFKLRSLFQTNAYLLLYTVHLCVEKLLIHFSAEYASAHTAMIRLTFRVSESEVSAAPSWKSQTCVAEYPKVPLNQSHIPFGFSLQTFCMESGGLDPWMTQSRTG